MKLNYDCLRDVLLSIESIDQISENFQIQPVWCDKLLSFPQLENYRKQDIIYSVMMAIEDKLIIGEINTIGYEITDFYILRLTAKGHEFVEKIRPKSNWDNIKEILQKLGVTSINIIGITAQKVVTESLTSLLKKP